MSPVPCLVFSLSIFQAGRSSSRFFLLRRTKLVLLPSVCMRVPSGTTRLLEQVLHKLSSPRRPVARCSLQPVIAAAGRLFCECRVSAPLFPAGPPAHCHTPAKLSQPTVDRFDQRPCSYGRPRSPRSHSTHHLGAIPRALCRTFLPTFLRIGIDQPRQFYRVCRSMHLRAALALLTHGLRQSNERASTGGVRGRYLEQVLCYSVLAIVKKKWRHSSCKRAEAVSYPHTLPQITLCLIAGR